MNFSLTSVISPYVGIIMMDVHGHSWTLKTTWQ